MSLFDISSVRPLAQSAIDTMIDQLGKQCKLFYDSATQQPCDNCLFDPIHQKSTGKYNGIGPFPFASGKCPRCNGAGYLPSSVQENFDIVKFIVDWQPRPSNYIDPLVKIPMGLVQTKGFITDMGKVKQAKSIIIDYQNANYQNNRFMLWGEPIPQGNIVPSRYFIAFWQRMV